MKSAINVQLRHAVALSTFFHAAMFGSIALTAVHLQAGRDLEYVQVELISPSQGDRRTSAGLHRLAPIIPPKEFKPQPATKHEADNTGPADKAPEVSHDAAVQTQKITQSYGNGSGARLDETEYQPFQRLEKIPSFKVQINPVYPLSERSAGVETRVIVEVYISAQGEVDDVKLVKSGGTPFDKAVAAAVRESIFEPGYMGGRPVPVKVQIPYVFKLK